MPKFLLGGDGRWHPYRKRSADERAWDLGFIHQAMHEQGLSVRATQAALAEQGVRLSVGSIHADRATPCTWCSGVQSHHLNTQDGSP